MKALKLVGALALALICMTMPAYAQDAVGAAITTEPWYSPILASVLALAGTVIAAAVTWAANDFRRRTGVEIDQKYQQFLQSALQNGMRYALEKSGWLPGNAIPPNIMDLAKSYVKDSVPDALKHFGGDIDLEKLLTPHLPTVNPSTAPSTDSVKPASKAAIDQAAASPSPGVTSVIADDVFERVLARIKEDQAKAAKKAASQRPAARSSTNKPS